ncbi:MAG: hypothetical protein H0W15_00265 [Gemmatimonadales bacterium]|nr:hypothetical protein [Gemmatimonadales bacterium]
MQHHWQILIGAILFTAACGTSSPDVPLAQEASRRQPGDRIDSVHSMAEYERRFRSGLVEPTRLEGGRTSREDLARAILRSIEAHDTAALAGLMVTPAEFSWLVYPSHRYREEPYALDPSHFWLQLQAGSAKGSGRMLERYGGDRISLTSLRCEREETTSGTNVILWAPCIATIVRNDRTEEGRYFGAIVERDGRFKLLSAGNDM